MDEQKLLVETILKKATCYKWSLQGFGMLRLYLNKEVRLHVWDDGFMVPGVSMIHDHPWSFYSKVVAGQICNERFERGPGLGRYKMATILCGPGGGMASSEPQSVDLRSQGYEHYREGMAYHQAASEIHQSHYLPGTVTLVSRTTQGDPDHAHVFWEARENWVSAEPRDATAEEVEKITKNALERWF